MSGLNDDFLLHIRAEVAEFFGVTVEEMLGKRRGEKVRCARIAFVQVLRARTNFSLLSIGRALGRDHTASIYMMKQHEFLSKKNSTYAEEYDMLNKHLAEKYDKEFIQVSEDLRPPRKRKDFPDPTKAHDSAVNRNDALFSARVEKSILEAVEEFKQKSGMTKKEITQAALLEYIDRHDPAPD